MMPARSSVGGDFMLLANATRLQEPGVIFQEFDGTLDSLADAQLRAPAQGANAAAVEEDERAVADPAPLAAGVGQVRLNTQVFADPADGVVDLAVFVRPQIEDIYFIGSLLNRQQHGVDAVLHIQIGLLLLAVSEHVEGIGMFEQLLVEVEDVPVRIPLAEDGHKAKYIGADVKSFGIGLNEAFGSELGSAVQGGLNRKRAGLRSRKDVGFAVDGPGGGEGDCPYAAFAHGFENIPGRESVLVEILAGLLRAEADVGIGGQVEDEIDACHGGAEGFAAEQIGRNQPVLGRAAGRLDERALTGGKIVVAD